LIEGLEASRDIDRWFFIRYHDDDDHVRFRVLSRERCMRDDVRRLTESALSDPIDDDPCWRIQSDVYQRELDRYGGPAGMECAERLFHADSTAVIDLLANPRTAGMPRWVLGLAGIYAVLEDFGFTLDERLSLADAQRAAFFAKMPLTKRRRSWLAGKARSERRHLESIPSLAESIFARRRTAWAGAIASLKQHRERVTVPLPSFVASIMHMHLNRLLGVGPRSQEAVLYDLLTCVCERVQRRPTAGAEV
jgi:thiopeptide-type bacteriocin biosynthesis protein